MHSLTRYENKDVSRGLGSAAQTASIESVAASGASATASTLVALGTIAPGVGTIIAGLVGVGVAIASMFKGCGQSCIITSQDADQVGSYLAQNIQTYLAAPVHYASLQKAALNNFDTAWASLEAACGQVGGSAGANCVSDRQSGSCKWKTSPGGWQQNNGTWTFVPNGPAGSGSTCWDWFVGYRDPIANDPTVVPDPPAATQATQAVTQASSAVSSVASAIGIPEVLMLAGLAIAGFMLIPSSSSSGNGNSRRYR